MPVVTRTPGLEAAKKLRPLPMAFVKQTLDAIDDVVASLEADHATGFEVTFANPVADPTWDFGRVKLVVRYVR